PFRINGLQPLFSGFACLHSLFSVPYSLFSENNRVGGTLRTHVPSVVKFCLGSTAPDSQASPPRAPRGNQHTPEQPYSSLSDRRDNPRYRPSLCLCRRASAPIRPRCHPDRRSALRPLCPCRQSYRLLSAAVRCCPALWLFRATLQCPPDWARTQPSNQACFHPRGSRI